MVTVTPLGINPYNSLNKRNNTNITKTLSSHRVANDVFSLSSMKKTKTGRLSFTGVKTDNHFIAKFNEQYDEIECPSIQAINNARIEKLIVKNQPSSFSYKPSSNNYNVSLSNTVFVKNLSGKGPLQNNLLMKDMSGIDCVNDINNIDMYNNSWINTVKKVNQIITYGENRIHTIEKANQIFINNKSHINKINDCYSLFITGEKSEINTIEKVNDIDMNGGKIGKIEDCQTATLDCDSHVDEINASEYVILSDTASADKIIIKENKDLDFKGEQCVTLFGPDVKVKEIEFESGNGKVYFLKDKEGKYPKIGSDKIIGGKIDIQE